MSKKRCWQTLKQQKEASTYITWTNLSLIKLIRLPKRWFTQAAFDANGCSRQLYFFRDRKLSNFRHCNSPPQLHVSNTAHVISKTKNSKSCCIILDHVLTSCSRKKFYSAGHRRTLKQASTSSKSCLCRTRKVPFVCLLLFLSNFAKSFSISRMYHSYCYEIIHRQVSRFGHFFILILKALNWLIF